MADGNHPRVVVTGTDSVASKPGLAVIRSLREARGSQITIFAADYLASSGGLHVGLADDSILLPHPTIPEDSDDDGETKFSWTSTNPSYVDSLLASCSSHRVNCLIPTLSMEIPIVCKNKTRLKEMGIRVLAPPLEGAMLVNDKWETYNFLRGQKIPQPRTWLWDTEVERAEFPVDPPVAVKSRRHGAWIALSHEEAQVIARRFQILWDEPPLIQEFLDGDAYCVCTVADRGHSLAAVVMKKISIDSHGTTTAGVTVARPDLLKVADLIVRKLRWSGALEVEWLRDPRDGICKVMEINSRFPCWVFLAAEAGLNLPDILLRRTLGDDISADLHYRNGVAFVRNAWDNLVDYSEIRSWWHRSSTAFPEIASRGFGTMK